MVRNQQVELIWSGKENRRHIEPHVLCEDPASSYRAAKRVSDNDIFDNRLVFGDNLPALAALEPEFRGQIKCVYIDPPYNTGQAQEHYDDGLEHSRWLGLMRDHCEILRTLLSPNGTLFCQLNDDEAAYAKVMLDEVFGRDNFLNQISVKMKQTAGASGGGEDKRLKKNIEYLLVYTKSIGDFERFNDVHEEERLCNLIETMRDEGRSWKYTRVVESFGKKHFLKEIEDGSGNPITIFVHTGVTLTAISDLMKRDGLSEEACYLKYFTQVFRDTNAQSSIRTRVQEATAGRGDFFSIEYVPQSGKSRGTLTTLYYKGDKRDLLAWLKDVAVRKGNRLFKRSKIGTYWDGFPLNNLTKEGDVRFPHGKKPEALIQRVLQLATNPGDLVLDSFLGSGTTAAAAHKMGRRWIGIERGDHCETHVIPRLQRLIDGEDSAGITKDVGWRGGGGFRYFRVAPAPS